MRFAERPSSASLVPHSKGGAAGMADLGQEFEFAAVPRDGAGSV
jgi:hypothetical protein